MGVRFLGPPLSRHLFSKARPKIGPMSGKLANFHGRVSIEWQWWAEAEPRG